MVTVKMINGNFENVINKEISLQEARKQEKLIQGANEYGEIYLEVVEKMYVAFSHKLSLPQIEDAKDKLKVIESIPLPESLQKEFSQVSPYSTWNDLQKFALEIVNDASTKGCTIMFCTGEPSLMMAINMLAKEVGMQVVQSTTERKTNEVIQPDGTSIKTQIFSHVMWREILK